VLDADQLVWLDESEVNNPGRPHTFLQHQRFHGSPAVDKMMRGVQVRAGVGVDVEESSVVAVFGHASSDLKINPAHTGVQCQR
jgi:hypothetical protein